MLKFHKDTSPLGACYVAEVEGTHAFHKLIKSVSGNSYMSEVYSSDWAGGDADYTIRASLLGDKALADRVTGASKFDWSSWVAHVRKRTYDVVGPYCNVHAAYAGNPVACVTKRKVKDAHKPVEIVHSISVASSVSPQSIVNRGAALLAAIEQLTIDRAVTLRIVYGNKMKGTTHFVSVTVDCRTMNRAQLAWLLLSPSVQRRAMFSIIDEYGHGATVNPGIPTAYDKGSKQSVWVDWMRDRAEASGATAFTTPGRYDFSLTEKQAEDWVTEAVAKHRV